MASNISGAIRQQFHELLQSRQISIQDTHTRTVTHRELSRILDALIDAVGSEMSIAIDESRSNHNGD